MPLTREAVAQKLSALLRHEIDLTELVDWAENSLMDADFEEADAETLRDAIARLGLADVRAFGLTWEDCESILYRLGYTAHLQIEALWPFPPPGPPPPSRATSNPAPAAPSQTVISGDGLKREINPDSSASCTCLTI